MPPDPTRSRRSARARAGRALPWLLLLALAAGACGGPPAAAGPSALQSAEPPASPTTSAPPEPPPSAPEPTVVPGGSGVPGGPSPAGSGGETPPPTEVPGPPVALLRGGGAAAGDRVRGDLGTFTWDGLGSDAPWIVPPDDREVRTAGRVSLAFDRPLPVERWAAAWAPIGPRGAGRALGGASGEGLPVSFRPPPGTWSVQVDVTFEPGRRGTWYWRVTAAP